MESKLAVIMILKMIGELSLNNFKNAFLDRLNSHPQDCYFFANHNCNSNHFETEIIRAISCNQYDFILKF
jgi:hypothetical protein